MPQDTTNLNKKTTRKVMHVHNEKKVQAFCEFYELTEKEGVTIEKLFSKYLDHGYTSVIKEKSEINGDSFNRDMIRYVRAGKNKNRVIFQYLLELASATKNASVAAKKLINANMVPTNK